MAIILISIELTSVEHIVNWEEEKMQKGKHLLTFIGLRSWKDGTMFFLHFFYIPLYKIYHLSYLFNLQPRKFD